MSTNLKHEFYDRHFALQQKICHLIRCGEDIRTTLRNKLYAIQYRILVANTTIGDIKSQGVKDDDLQWFIDLFSSGIRELLRDLEERVAKFETFVVVG